MSVGLYLDVHVPAAIARGLLLRGVDVMTAQLNGTTELEDSALLDRATELGRVLFSQDVDLLAEATKRQRSGERFGGVIVNDDFALAVVKSVQSAVMGRSKGARERSKLGNFGRFQNPPP